MGVMMEFIFNTRQMIRNGYPMGLEIDEFESAYKKFFPHCLLPKPANFIFTFTTQTWANAFMNCEALNKWFRVNRKNMILVRPVPEPDLRTYLRHNQMDHYQLVRRNAKADNLSSISDSEKEYGGENMDRLATVGSPIGMSSNRGTSQGTPPVPVLRSSGTHHGILKSRKRVAPKSKRLAKQHKRSRAPAPSSSTSSEIDFDRRSTREKANASDDGQVSLHLAPVTNVEEPNYSEKKEPVDEIPVPQTLTVFDVNRNVKVEAIDLSDGNSDEGGSPFPYSPSESGASSSKDYKSSSASEVHGSRGSITVASTCDDQDRQDEEIEDGLRSEALEIDSASEEIEETLEVARSPKSLRMDLITTGHDDAETQIHVTPEQVQTKSSNLRAKPAQCQSVRAARVAQRNPVQVLARDPRRFQQQRKVTWDPRVVARNNFVGRFQQPPAFRPPYTSQNRFSSFAAGRFNPQLRYPNFGPLAPKPVPRFSVEDRVRAEVEYLCRPWSCRLCRIAKLSETTSISHYNGSRHSSALQNLLDCRNVTGVKPGDLLPHVGQNQGIIKSRLAKGSQPAREDSTQALPSLSCSKLPDDSWQKICLSLLQDLLRNIQCQDMDLVRKRTDYPSRMCWRLRMIWDSVENGAYTTPKNFAKDVGYAIGYFKNLGLASNEPGRKNVQEIMDTLQNKIPKVVNGFNNCQTLNATKAAAAPRV